MPAGPEHDRSAVGGPRHVGVDAGDRPCLLHVLVERIIDLAFSPAVEVLDVELRLARFTPHESDALAIGGGGRADRSACARHGGARLAGHHVIALDVEQVGVRILRIFEDRAGGHVAREEDALAVGGVDRFAKLLLQFLTRALDQLHAAAARDVIHPYLAGAERARGGEMLLGDDEAAVGAPARLVEQAEVFLGQLALVAAIQIHQPDIVAAAAIRHEGNALAVGREARLLFIGEALGDPRRGAAGDRHGIDVAEQVEREHRAVARHVDVHPAPLADRDRHLPRRHAGGRVDVPFGWLGRGRSWGGGWGWGGLCRKGGGEHQPSDYRGHIVAHRNSCPPDRW